MMPTGQSKFYLICQIHQNRPEVKHVFRLPKAKLYVVFDIRRTQSFIENSMARSINNASSTGQKQIKYYNISDLVLVFGCLRTN